MLYKFILNDLDKLNAKTMFLVKLHFGLNTIAVYVLILLNLIVNKMN